eukprot:GHVU01107101.1.p1 GENE.GHVU01107101.1~~GHVU01107101.1.p1  ORF type:complete len:181 (+),score=14.89 GHVU01107101.1:212-754(+)
MCKRKNRRDGPPPPLPRDHQTGAELLAYRIVVDDCLLPHDLCLSDCPTDRSASDPMRRMNGHRMRPLVACKEDMIRKPVDPIRDEDQSETDEGTDVVYLPMRWCWIPRACVWITKAPGSMLRSVAYIRFVATRAARNDTAQDRRSAAPSTRPSSVELALFTEGPRASIVSLAGGGGGGDV